MPALPPRLSLEQVRRLAKDLLRDLKDAIAPQFDASRSSDAKVWSVIATTLAVEAAPERMLPVDALAVVAAPVTQLHPADDGEPEEPAA